MFPGIYSHSPRQLLVTGALVLWAGRLGTFLLDRVLREGRDSRFDQIKHKPGVFFGYWMGQGGFLVRFVPEKGTLTIEHIATWIATVGLPVYLVSVCLSIYA